MEKLYYTILVSICVFSFGIGEIMAQAGRDSLIQRDLLLEKDYVPSIEAAGKVYSTPALETMKTEKTQVQFATSEMPSSIPSEYVPLSAAEAQISFPAQQQRGYIRLGGGNHFSFLGDAQWNVLRQSKQVLDLNLWYRSMAVPDPAVNVAMDNDLRMQLNYKLHLNAVEMEAAIAERLYFWNYYAGSGNALKYPDIQQSSDTKFSVSLHSKPWDKNFDYAFSIDGHLFKLGESPSPTTLYEGVSEKELDARLDLVYHFNEDWTVSLSGRVRALGYRNEENVYRIDTISNCTDNIDDRFWVEVNPKVGYALDLWNFSLGLRLSSLSGSSVKVAPTVSVSRPIGRQAAFNVNIDGGQELKSYREGLMLNPYLDPSIRLLPEYSPFKIKTSLTWRPFEGMTLEPNFSYTIVNNVPLFFNAVPANAKLSPINFCSFFSVEYDKVSSVYAGLNMTYAYKNRVRFNVDYRFCYDDMIVWYKPAHEMDVFLEVTPMERLAISAAYHWEGLRSASTENSFYTRLDDLHYLTANCSYRIMPRWTAFVQVKNAVNQSYEIWYKYPNYGLTGLLGLSFSF